MYDLTSEQLILLTEAPAHFPATKPGKKVHILSVRRWARDGADNVFLETIDLGSRVYTSVEAIGRFLRARARKRRKGLPAHLRLVMNRRAEQRQTSAYRRAQAANERRFAGKGRRWDGVIDGARPAAEAPAG